MECRVGRWKQALYCAYLYFTDMLHMDTYLTATSWQFRCCCICRRVHRALRLCLYFSRNLLTATLTRTITPAHRPILTWFKLDSWLRSVYAALTVWVHPRKEPQIVLPQVTTSDIVGHKLHLERIGFTADDLFHTRLKKVLVITIEMCIVKDVSTATIIIPGKFKPANTFCSSSHTVPTYWICASR